MALPYFHVVCCLFFAEESRTIFATTTLLKPSTGLF